MNILTLRSAVAATAYTGSILLSSVSFAQDVTDLDTKVAEALPKIQALAQETLEETGIPAIAMAVVYKDEVVLIDTLGVREAGKPEPVNEETVFQIASLSKPMATSVGAVVVGRELAEWTDPVVVHDPGFRLSNDWLAGQVTIADFFSHRSGLPGHAGDKLEDLGYNRHDILARIRGLEPEYPIRNGYDYTNFGFTEAGVAIARAADLEWEDAAAQFIFEPLGMNSTSYRYSDYLAASNRAAIHVQVEPGVWEPLYSRDPDAQAPAGGLSTTITDYTQWMRMQLNEGAIGSTTIIDFDALVQTWRPHSQTGFNPDTRTASYYGLGWDTGHDDDGGFRLTHSGAFDLGVRTAVRLYPDIDLGIAVFVNGGINGIPEGLNLSFFDYVFHGELTRDWVAFANEQFVIATEQSYGYGGDYSTPPDNPVPAKPDSAYVATYTNDYWGDIIVYEANGNLVFDMGPLPQTFELTHWDGDEFLYQPIGESAGPLSKFTFEFAEGNNLAAEGILVEYYDVERDGYFERKQSWLDHDGWARIFEFAFIHITPAPLESGPAAWLWINRQDWQDWAWTSEAIYPWMYSIIDQDWIYFGDISVDRSQEENDFVFWWFYFSESESWDLLYDILLKESDTGISPAAGIDYLVRPHGYEADWSSYISDAINDVTVF